jgi:energy-coupling factor transporter ATP-binding protein EcfA2
MKLHRIQVENFRRFKKYAVDLLGPDGNPRPLTVVVGPNMSGKTTLLDAVHLAYEAIANARKPRWRPGLDPADPTLRPDPNQPIEVSIELSLHEGEYEALRRLEQALGSSFNVAPATVYSFTLRWPPPAQSPHGVTESIPMDAQLAFRGRALAGMALKRKVATERCLDEVGGVFYLDQNRRGRLREAALKADMSAALQKRAVPSDVLGWLVRAAILDQKWDPEVQGESQWHRVKRLFADLAAPAVIDDMRPSDDGYDLRLLRDGRPYYSAGMSSGERQILRLVANLVYLRAVRSVVLIDELELNLHPRWQRSLLRFCQTGGDDDNQFIVTTHSDTLLRYVDASAVVVLDALDPA